MSEYESRPIRSLHSIYTRSSLEEWFRLDVWRPKEAMCLLCDIDPEMADIDWPDKDSVEPGFNADGPIINNASLFSYRWSHEPLKYLTADEKARYHRYRLNSLEDVDPKTLSKEDKKFAEIAEASFELAVAEDTLKSLWIIFRRTKDAKEIDSSGTEPQWYVQWALKRGFKIPWLEWAVQHGFLVEDSTESQLKTNEKLQRDKPYKRKQEGLQAAIEVLNQKHANGELNDRQDFEQCMGKAEVIAFIRANPEEYPCCDEIKPKDREGIIKDREPTLTRNFPDFRKDPTILAEYEELTNNN